MSYTPTPEQILNVLRAAQQAALKQDYPQALQKYLWVAEQIWDDPDNLPLVQIEIAWAYYHLQQYDKVIAYLERALESKVLTFHQIYDALRLIGICYNLMGENAKAIAYLEDAVIQPIPDKDRRYAMFELGKMYYANNDIKKSQPYFASALPLFDKDEAEYQQTCKYYLGMIAFFDDDLATAEAYFTDFLQNAVDAEDKSPGLFGMAHIYFKQKDFSKLVEVAEKILSSDRDFFDKETLAYFLCVSYLETGKWADSRRFLEQLKKRNPRGRYARDYKRIDKLLTEKGA
jgi:tetratricopeptide (TPR) repeat protein